MLCFKRWALFLDIAFFEYGLKSKNVFSNYLFFFKWLLQNRPAKKTEYECQIFLAQKQYLLSFWGCIRPCLSSSFSVINSFSWLGLIYIRLLSLPLSLPGFAFLNGSPLSKLLMDLTAFLFNGMTDTPSLPFNVNQFYFLQGCLSCWSFMSVACTFWLASTAFTW